MTAKTAARKARDRDDIDRHFEAQRVAMERVERIKSKIPAADAAKDATRTAFEDARYLVEAGDGDEADVRAKRSAYEEAQRKVDDLQSALQTAEKKLKEANDALHEARIADLIRTAERIANGRSGAAEKIKQRIAGLHKDVGAFDAINEKFSVACFEGRRPAGGGLSAAATLKALALEFARHSVEPLYGGIKQARHVNLPGAAGVAQRAAAKVEGLSGDLVEDTALQNALLLRMLRERNVVVRQPTNAVETVRADSIAETVAQLDPSLKGGPTPISVILKLGYDPQHLSLTKRSADEIMASLPKVAMGAEAPMLLIAENPTSPPAEDLVSPAELETVLHALAEARERTHNRPGIRQTLDRFVTPGALPDMLRSDQVPAFLAALAEVPTLAGEAPLEK